ncbi:amidohydrolase [Clostridium sp. 'deep sea']|uniref:amidohydrolase n=1 Tax=Clostridium sp. 'deep sea' TaxID=2779445 RepID=UPI00189692C9|nr:amidohydrolase [Clostridium sp. 'deep sea']QOR36114.1 amidohydrolase [Clostridium sp. 'deep sea']
MICIYNAKVYTMAGPVIENGYVTIEDGKILDVGEMSTFNCENTCTCVKIDAKGQLLLPGFVEAHCHLGMMESGIGFEGNDVNEMTNPVTAQVRAVDGMNPMDVTVKEALEAGVTSAATGPGSGNVIGGTFMVIKTHGKRVDDMVYRDPVAMKCAFGENPKRVYNAKKRMPTTRMGTAAIMREALAKTKQYLEKIEAAGDDYSKYPAYDANCEALLPVIKREIPLKVHAHRADDMFTAIRIANEFNVRYTLDHATEGHLIAEELAEENVVCIVGPSFGHRSKFELQEKTFNTPGILAKAGIKVAITTDSPVVPLDSLPMMASLANEAGMDEMEALKAITINAAEILGVDDVVGSIEKGKDADLVIYSGHPFDITSKAQKVFVNGEEVFTR